MAYLVLIRHGESEWNEKGLWQGWTDVPLDYTGWEQAHNTAKAIKDIQFDRGFTSALSRAKETLDIILRDLKQANLAVDSNSALNERDYGDYTGKNKWEIEKELGEEKFEKILREFDYPIPNGESLKTVYDRIVPYFEQEILPLLKEDKNIIVSAHGNSLRALVKYLEDLSNEQVAQLEIRTAEAYVYKFDENGKIISKEIRAQNDKEV